MKTPTRHGPPVARGRYTDAAGIGGAEISLTLVTNVSGHIDMTVLGTSQLVVDAIAARRAGVSRVVLPATGLGTATAHLQALYRLRPDVVHVNLCTPGGCDRTRGGADVARCSCRAR